MSVIRVGVVGLGYFAQNHLEAWRIIDDAEIVAICDSDPVRLAAARAKFGVAGAFDNLDDMLASTALDVVDVATAAASHRAMVEKVARAGKAVICQKPMAETIVDARAMVAACSAASVSFMIHENFRFQRTLRRLKERVEAGVVGTPFFARVSFRSPRDVFNAQPYLATDERFIVLDLGIHLIDVARCLMGEATDISCWTKRVNPRIRGEDVATMVLDHGKGRVTLVDCSYATQCAPDPWPRMAITVEGDRGTIELDQQDRIHLTKGGATETEHVPPRRWPWSETPLDAIQDSVVAIQQHWLDHHRAGTTPETSGEDNLKVVELVHAAYRDADQRGLRN